MQPSINWQLFLINYLTFFNGQCTFIIIIIIIIRTKEKRRGNLGQIIYFDWNSRKKKKLINKQGQFQ